MKSFVIVTDVDNRKKTQKQLAPAIGTEGQKESLS